MEYFKEILEKIINFFLIHESDSETTKAKKILTYSFIGSIFTLFFVSWIIFTIFTFSTQIVKVPNIEGDNIYTALDKLSQKKLVANVQPKFSDIYENGIVFTQNPQQGSLVKEGRVITFSVSLGSFQKALPDFRGFTLFELATYLDKQYATTKVPYKIGVPIYEFNDKVEKGRIIRQEPKEGTLINYVKEVKVWISNGIKDDEIKTLNNYAGKNFSQISIDLANLEIFYNVNFVYNKDKNKNFIIEGQSIGEGAIIEDLIQEDKIVTFTVNINNINNETVTDFYHFDLPRKPLPYKVDFAIGKSKTEQKLFLTIFTKGGVRFPIPYYDKENSKLFVYIESQLYKEIVLKEEIKQEF